MNHAPSNNHWSFFPWVWRTYMFEWTHPRDNYFPVAGHVYAKGKDFSTSLNQKKSGFEGTHECSMCKSVISNLLIMVVDPQEKSITKWGWQTQRPQHAPAEGTCVSTPSGVSVLGSPTRILMLLAGQRREHQSRSLLVVLLRFQTPGIGKYWKCYHKWTLPFVYCNRRITPVQIPTASLSADARCPSPKPCGAPSSWFRLCSRPWSSGTGGARLACTTPGRKILHGWLHAAEQLELLIIYPLPISIG